MATKYDAIVIGTGQAGPSLAVRLADKGMKMAIIERKRFGGTCVNNGCIPTKTLAMKACVADSENVRLAVAEIALATSRIIVSSVAQLLLGRVDGEMRLIFVGLGLRDDYSGGL